MREAVKQTGTRASLWRMLPAALLLAAGLLCFGAPAAMADEADDEVILYAGVEEDADDTAVLTDTDGGEAEAVAPTPDPDPAPAPDPEPLTALEGSDPDDLQDEPTDQNDEEQVQPPSSGWVADENGTRHYTDGVLDTGWIQEETSPDGTASEARRYYLDENGLLQRGTLTLEGTRYYCDEELGYLISTLAFDTSDADFTHLLARYTPAAPDPALTAVRVAVRRNENTSQRYWYAARLQQDGTWLVDFDDCDLLYQPGEYRMDFFTYFGDTRGLYAGVLTKQVDTGLTSMFQVVSDTQVVPWYGTEAKHFQKALQVISRTGSDGVIINGDLVENSTQAEYDYLFSLMRGEGFDPSFFTYNMGNHELRTQWGESYWTLLQRYLANTGVAGPYYETTVAGQTCLFIGSDLAPVSCVGARYSTDMLTWLDGRLAELTAGDRPVFLFMHHPLTNTVRGSQDGTWASSWENCIENSEEARAVIAKYSNLVVFSSHTHWCLEEDASYQARGGPLYVNTAALAYIEDIDEDGFEGAEGWYVFEFEDGIVLKAYDFFNDRWVASTNSGAVKHVLTC